MIIFSEKVRVADDTAGSVTMTIAGIMVPLIIRPHAINNLLIHSLVLFIF